MYCTIIEVCMRNITGNHVMYKLSIKVSTKNVTFAVNQNALSYQLCLNNLNLSSTKYSSLYDCDWVTVKCIVGCA